MIFLLTSPPGTGKSTVLKSLLDASCKSEQACGIIAHEMRDSKGERVGFFAQQARSPFAKRTFAHIHEIKSEQKIGPFHVDLSAIDDFVVPELQYGIKSRALIFFDEIGRMQALSESFLACTRQAFDSETIIFATIVYDPEPWSIEFKQHPQATLIELTKENRNFVGEAFVALVPHFETIRKLPAKGQKAFGKLFQQYLSAQASVQLSKLLNHALRYVVESKVTREHNGTFIVSGDHGKYSVGINSNNYTCTCDLFNGREGYKPGECSHIQSVTMYSALF